MPTAQWTSPLTPPTFRFLSAEALAVATDEEREWYRKAVLNHTARLSPLDMLEALEPGTRRWPHLELLNEMILALCEYRLTAGGPVPKEGPGGAAAIEWAYADQDGSWLPALSPYTIPDDAIDYRGVHPEYGPVVFRLSVSLRPRAGKSHLITEMLPRWLLLQDPDIHVLVATYSDDFATEWGGKFRDACIRYEREHRLDFLPYPREGERAPKEAFVPREGTGSVRFVGVGGGVTGKTGNVLIADDLLKNDKQAQSEQERKNAHDFYSSTWTTRKTASLKPGSKFPIPVEVLLGTRWHADDVIGHYAYDEDGIPRDDWFVLNIPVFSEGPGDPLGRPEGVMHPSAGGESATQLRAKQKEDPRSFAALYQGRPTVQGGGTIPGELAEYTYHHETADTPAHFVYVDADRGRQVVWDSDTIRFACVDAAGTKKTSADFTVMDIFAYSREHDVAFVVRHYRDHIGTEQYVEVLLPLLRAERANILVTEDITYGRTLGEDMRREGITIEYAPAQADKVAKVLASRLPGRIRSGRVRVPVGAPYAPQLQDELRTFPYSRNDDQVDALAFGAWYVENKVPAWRAPRSDGPQPTTVAEALALREEQRLEAAERRAKGGGRTAGGRRRWPLGRR